MIATQKIKHPTAVSPSLNRIEMQRNVGIVFSAELYDAKS